MTKPSTLQSHTDRLKAYQGLVEESLGKWLPSAATPPKEIHQAMHYSLQAGGKRLRPVLVLAAADLYPGEADPLPAAVAIECFHTYTLIHDDLPCMDNSPLRRGRPSAHIQFDEATAVLAGDALLTEAFSLIARHYIDHPVECARLVACLAKAGDSQHLIGGQVLDTLSENRSVSAEELAFIHEHKTADLISCALEMGLILARAPEAAITILRAVGQDIGHAFQIIDDILDATATTEQLGKTVGNDARQAKNTYVSLHGMEAARIAARNHTQQALQACRSLDTADTSFLEFLVERLEHRLH